jgi:hypothetical protein
VPGRGSGGSQGSRGSGCQTSREPRTWHGQEHQRGPAVLVVAAKDARSRNYEAWWDPVVVNRWVLTLPAANSGRWQYLLLSASSNGWASRNNIIAHAEALVAFLEANKLALSSRKPNGAAAEITIEAEFAKVTEPRRKAKKLLKQLPFFRG